MSDLVIKHNTFSAEEFVFLWESVWGQGPSIEQTRLAMENTLFRVSIYDGARIVAMPDKIPFYEKFGFSANEAQRLRIMYQVHG